MINFIQQILIYFIFSSNKLKKKRKITNNELKSTYNIYLIIYNINSNENDLIQKLKIKKKREKKEVIDLNN